jgi:hypothetical protein
MAAHLQTQIDSRPGILRFSDYPTNHKKDATVLTSATCRRLWGKEDRCGTAEEAVIIDGNERGKTMLLCRDKECPKHGLQARRAGGGDNSDRVARKKHRIEKVFRQRLFAEIRARVKALPTDKVTRIVAREMWRRLGGDCKRALLKAVGTEAPREAMEQFGDRLIEKASPVELGRMMVCMAIADELMVSTFQPGKAETMLQLADLYGVDVKTVRETAKSTPKPRSTATKRLKPAKARVAA